MQLAYAIDTGAAINRKVGHIEGKIGFCGMGVPAKIQLCFNRYAQFLCVEPKMFMNQVRTVLVKPGFYRCVGSKQVVCPGDV
ncbi:hypothetical protein MCAMS1_01318 [biofilm metagenome]